MPWPQSLSGLVFPILCLALASLPRASAQVKKIKTKWSSLSSPVGEIGGLERPGGSSIKVGSEDGCHGHAKLGIVVTIRLLSVFENKNLNHYMSWCTTVVYGLWVMGYGLWGYSMTTQLRVSDDWEPCSLSKRLDHLFLVACVQHADYGLWQLSCP
jgi:hypothetical protein